MPHAVSTRPPDAREHLVPRAPSRQSSVRPGVLTVVAVLVFAAALLDLGLDGLIPFGLLIAFGLGSGEVDSQAGGRALPTQRRRGRGDGGGVRVVLAVASPADRVDALADCRLLIVLPLTLQESERPARERTVSVTRRDLVLALWALVVLVDLYYAYGQSLNVLMATCIVLPVVLAASRAWGARRGLVERRLVRHPFRRDVRPHLAPGPEHLAVLPAAGRRRRRRGHALRADLALLGRRPVQRHGRRLRGRPAPPRRLGSRPPSARQPGHQRPGGPAARASSPSSSPPSPPHRALWCSTHHCPASGSS